MCHIIKFEFSGWLWIQNLQYDIPVNSLLIIGQLLKIPMHSKVSVSLLKLMEENGIAEI